MIFTLAQINPTVGALEHNKQKIVDVWREITDGLVIFPELAICGYPPEDLILKACFLDEIERLVKAICKESENFKAGALIGCPWRNHGKVYNCVHLIDKGKIIATRFKHHLPNYGVFDEKRIFEAGPLPTSINYKNNKLGVMICEDMWFDDVSANLKAHDAQTLIAINSSPYTVDKHETRLAQAQKRAKENALPLIVVNQVGGQDELVFDGGSFAVSADGDTNLQMPFFEENIETYSRESQSSSISKQDNDKLTYDALKLGIQDYVLKNNFPGVLIGLSGGVDSALAAVLAVDALGADKVHCVMMPSQYTSQESLDDASTLAENLKCSYEVIAIKDIMKAYKDTLEGLSGTAHENMQSRARGLILMSLSNMNGKMVLTTGNKSEMAVGYATLYGDMCGGFNALKDVYKTKVYELCQWRNKQENIIPERILTRAPSAELRDDQTDQDSLPEYEVLDAILERLIEHDMGTDEIIAENFEAKTVEHIAKMLRRAEYKRYQSAPGAVITNRAFGRDRRYPITSRFEKA